jgi:hypothetical protein
LFNQGILGCSSIRLRCEFLIGHGRTIREVNSTVSQPVKGCYCVGPPSMGFATMFQSNFVVCSIDGRSPATPLLHQLQKLRARNGEVVSE